MVTLDEALGAVAAASQHPDNRPRLRHLCDLTAVTGVERDFPQLFAMQAKFLEHLDLSQGEMIVAFLAPTPAGQEMAQMAKRSWEGLNAVIVLVHDNEAETLALLGLPETTLATLTKSYV
jgi:hypothetical protein